MNYLAHSVLSFWDENIIVGNFIADHIRLSQVSSLPEGIQKGVQIHRKIDHFTDTHPLFAKNKRCFYNGFERYSGVLLDIYFDHILARNFSRFSDLPLTEYSKDIYAVLDKNSTYLPEGSKGFLNYVKQNNTFFEYSKQEGIELVLRHLSYRIGHGVDLSASLPLLVKNYNEIERDFFVFMDEITTHVRGLMLQ